MLMQLREMMEYQQKRDEYDGVEDAANSDSGGLRRAAYRREGHSGEMSQRGEEDASDDDEEAMSPRGVYVQRTLCALFSRAYIYEPFKAELSPVPCFLVTGYSRSVECTHTVYIGGCSACTLLSISSTEDVLLLVMSFKITSEESKRTLQLHQENS
jgi:hypothetical protein